MRVFSFIQNIFLSGRTELIPYKIFNPRARNENFNERFLSKRKNTGIEVSGSVPS